MALNEKRETGNEKREAKLRIAAIATQLFYAEERKEMGNKRRGMRNGGVEVGCGLAAETTTKWPEPKGLKVIASHRMASHGCTVLAKERYSRNQLRWDLGCSDSAARAGTPIHCTVQSIHNIHNIHISSY